MKDTEPDMDTSFLNSSTADIIALSDSESDSNESSASIVLIDDRKSIEVIEVDDTAENSDNDDISIISLSDSTVVDWETKSDHFKLDTTPDFIPITDFYRTLRPKSVTKGLRRKRKRKLVKMKEKIPYDSAGSPVSAIPNKMRKRKRTKRSAVTCESRCASKKEHKPTIENESDGKNCNSECQIPECPLKCTVRVNKLQAKEFAIQESSENCDFISIPENQNTEVNGYSSFSTQKRKASKHVYIPANQKTGMNNFYSSFPTQNGPTNNEFTCVSANQSSGRTVYPKFPTRIIQLSYPNTFNDNATEMQKNGLRPIIIDGCNVGFGYGNGSFVMHGLILVIQYFKRRGHDEIVCFLPNNYRHRVSSPAEEELVNSLVKENVFSFTPSRQMTNGKRFTPYDDRYILQYATERQGVIISNDGYRDLINEESSWKETIEKRIVNYTFARGMFMLPKDPLGPTGPTLDEMLRFP